VLDFIRSHTFASSDFIFDESQPPSVVIHSNARQIAMIDSSNRAAQGYRRWGSRGDERKARSRELPISPETIEKIVMKENFLAGIIHTT